MRRAQTKVELCCRVNPELHRRLVDAAAERGLSLSGFCDRLLGEAVDRLVPAADLLIKVSPSGRSDGGSDGSH